MTTPALFQPFQIGPIRVANRIAVAPMCQYCAKDGVPNDWHRVHLGSLALSGAGLLTVEATAVEAAGRITHGCLGLYSDDSAEALGDIVRMVRGLSDVRLGIQIGHAGRKASTAVPWEGGAALGPDDDPWLTYGPSALPLTEAGPEVREMDAADMARIREAHVAAAIHARDIGFDLLELHMAHGYLLSTFLSPLTNRRTDEYGGDLAGRLRFPLEVARAVREVWPRDRALSAKFNGTDWADGGLTPEDAAPIATALRDAGLDIVTTSGGGVLPAPPPRIGPGYQLDAARVVKAEVPGIAVAGVGMIFDPKTANAIVEAGDADMVSIARAFLHDPRWALHAAAALDHEVAWPPQYARATPATWRPARPPAATDVR